MLLFRINTYSNNANITYGIDVIDKERTVRQYANLSDNAEEIKSIYAMASLPISKVFLIFACL